MSKARVILVSDPNSTPWSKSAKLKMEGVEIVQCDGGFDALSELVGDGAAAIISTTWLPDISGYQLCSYIKTSDKMMALPVFLIRSDSEDEDTYGFWKGAAMPDHIVEIEAFTENDDALTELVERAVALGDELGWHPEQAKESGIAGVALGSQRVAESYAHLFDLLLTDRLVAGIVRSLSGVTDSKGNFVKSFFRIMCTLLDLDLCGFFLNSETSPWGVFQVSDTVSVTAYDGIKKDAVDKLSNSTPVAIELIGETRAKGGKSFKQCEVLPIGSEDMTLGLLVVGTLDKKGFDEPTLRFVQKLELNLLPVTRLLIAFQEIERLASEAAFNASIDQLTGLYNLEFLVGFLQQQLLFSYRQRLPVSLALIDVDNLAEINESHGIDVGNHVLRTVANRLLIVTRSSDLTARYGGDEFAVVLPNTDVGGARILAEKVRRDIERQNFQYRPNERGPRVTVSVGCANFNMEDLNPETIILDAKLNLQKAKEGGSKKVTN
ncbi:MAG: diguanylate cyclase [Candidatus Obscuribacterales bacterium]|nr:diguanylate cyclase [Candidatus Obscuribacterales bacterium]